MLASAMTQLRTPLARGYMLLWWLRIGGTWLLRLGESVSDVGTYGVAKCLNRLVPDSAELLLSFFEFNSGIELFGVKEDVIYLPYCLRDLESSG